jgi:3-deoxy-D-manno-octulosonate 8-phosphate phosphatase (KDO 8-P phosphatase)
MVIRLVVLDLDGVLTDGTVLLLEDGDQVRAIHFHDLDAVGSLRRRGVPVAIISGEDTPSSHRVAARFGIEDVTWGAKEKVPALEALVARRGVQLAEVAYIGDGDRDAPAIAAAGLGFAPADATPAAQAAADHVVPVNGGRGVVAAAVRILDQLDCLPKEIPVS